MAKKKRRTKKIIKKKTKKTAKKKVRRRSAVVKAKHGNRKMDNPVDKSIRLDQDEWDMIDSMCPTTYAFAPWADKLRHVLECAKG